MPQERFLGDFDILNVILTTTHDCKTVRLGILTFSLIRDQFARLVLDLMISDVIT